MTSEVQGAPAAERVYSPSGKSAIARLDAEIDAAKTHLKALRQCRAKVVRYEAIIEPYLAMVEKELSCEGACNLQTEKA